MAFRGCGFGRAGFTGLRGSGAQSGSLGAPGGIADFRNKDGVEGMENGVLGDRASLNPVVVLDPLGTSLVAQELCIECRPGRRWRGWHLGLVAYVRFRVQALKF